ncbi:MAG: HlyD family type I secretion periplasmic adaptor subunit [Pseudomonadota bacterium]
MSAHNYDEAPNDGAGGLIAAAFACIGLIFGGFAAWSVLAPLEGAVIAAGNVEVAGSNKAVQHLEGGIVGEIFVEEGEIVAADDLLIRLDGASIEARLASTDARLAALLARKSRLIAERDGGAALAHDDDIKAFLSDERIVTRLSDDFAGQAALFDARRASRMTEVDLLRQRIAQHNNRIDGLLKEAASKARQGELITEEIGGLRTLAEKGYAPKNRILALERQREQLLGEEGAHRAAIAEARTAIGEAQLEIARLTKGFREDVLSELRDVDTEIAELREQRVAALDSLHRLEIRAPTSGAVLGVVTHTVGGVIASGEPLMYIVPDANDLVVGAKINPADVDKVAPGAAVRIRFSAFNQNTTPEAAGIVKTVSADALLDETSGLSHYKATVALNPDSIPDGVQFRLVPGMPAEVFVRTESRSAASYFLKPFQDALANTFKES